MVRTKKIIISMLCFFRNLFCNNLSCLIGQIKMVVSLYLSKNVQKIKYANQLKIIHWVFVSQILNMLNLEKNANMHHNALQKYAKKHVKD